MSSYRPPTAVTLADASAAADAALAAAAADAAARVAADDNDDDNDDHMCSGYAGRGCGPGEDQFGLPCDICAGAAMVACPDCSGPDWTCAEPPPKPSKEEK